MSWLQLVLRRGTAEAGVLAVMTALTVAACSVLGSLAVLLTAAQDRALGATLVQAQPDDVVLHADLALDGYLNSPGDARVAVDTAAATLSGLAGTTAPTTSVWPTTGAMLMSDDAARPATYLATVPDPDLVRVVAGSIPERDARAGGAVVPVAIPAAAAADLGWTVGDRFEFSGSNDRSEVTVEVAGVYEISGPPSAWRQDLLDGTGFDPAFPLPESFGFTTVRIWGPLLVPEAVLLDGVVPASDARVSVAPGLDGPGGLTGLDQAGAAALQDRLGHGQAVLEGATEDVARSARLTTSLDDTLAGVAAGLAVTRTGIVVVGLALVLVSGAALLLAARLLAEQRGTGLTLMAARGASRRQLLAAAAGEAAVVAVVAACVAPALAALLVAGLAEVTAGGAAAVPSLAGVVTTPALWWTCAVSAVLFAALLVVPVLRAVDVDDDVRVARPGATTFRAVLVRSGGTAAVLVLGMVSAWQLTRYGPASAGGGTDPVLVAAPALLILSGALLVTRVLPFLARLSDGAAARSRFLTVPLAAWETGRRPERAAGTALLVTLALAGGTFAQVTLATWRASQIDQATLALGADARLTDVPGSPLDASERAAAVPAPGGGGFTPVTDRIVPVGPVHDDARLSSRLLAVDDPAVLRGRVTPGAGLAGAGTWPEIHAVLAAPSGPAAGVPVPAGTERLSARVEARMDAPVDLQVQVGVVLEDADGVRGQYLLARAPGDPQEIALRDDGPAGPGVRIVGIVVQAVAPELTDPMELIGSGDVPPLRITVTDLLATDAAGDRTEIGLGRRWAASSLPPAGGAVVGPGTGSSSPAPVIAEVDQGGLTLTQDVDPVALALGSIGLVAAPGAAHGDVLSGPGTSEKNPLPVVVNQALATAAEVGPGDVLRTDVPFVHLEVAGVVGHLPGESGQGMLADRSALQAAELAAGRAARAPDAWWGSVPGDDAREVAAFTAAAEDTGVLRTLAAKRAALLEGPDRVGLHAALWLLTGAAIVLAGAGTASSVATGLALRRLELARLQALGVPRGKLVRAVLAEQGILLAAAFVGGATAGGLVAVLLAPVLAVGPGGGKPVPEAVLQVPWPALALLGAVALLVTTAVTAATARARVRRASSDLLRMGADR
ncbi:FtsX-like permease family protein [Myceligenerans crystallogenes]|uniref:ABC3 transporter permease C-terminal domain-containing protein n=1 Tax=Myceligenerans crystallogenes TaxID=316335 RepID=A0ABP4ZXZ7_9MICO